MPPQNIVIIGAGIVGTSTAYYTAKHAQRNGAKVTLVEATGVACAASGKAGGFLAKDWHGAATSSEQALPTMAYDITLNDRQACLPCHLTSMRSSPRSSGERPGGIVVLMRYQ